jgi:gluconate 2-dehydrogenase subunit 3-like protein
VSRLRFPDLRRLAPEHLPVDLRPPAAEPAPAERPAGLLLGRRQFLKALGVVLAAVSAPLTWVERTVAAARGRFLTASEFHTLEALCEVIIPADGDPGARELGAARYIGALLSALDGRTPRIFASGPFSNRNRFPDNDTGTASLARPRNAFRHFIPLTRVQDLRWRAELFGSAAVPGAEFNDAALGPLTGLRDIYRNGIAQLDALAKTSKGAPFADLSSTDQADVFAAADQAGIGFDPRRGVGFIDLLIQHTLEGCFAVPEYGGNRHGQGWRMIGLEGDDQPLGYSIFSRQTNGYNERPDHPMSTPNPDEVGPGGTVVPKPLSADGQYIQQTLAYLSMLFGG